MQLHPLVKDRLDDDRAASSIETQESAIRIIDKTGPLDNPADRDHCIQYMVAVPLIFGRLTAADYEDDVAADPRIDALRDKMDVRRGHAVHARLPRPGQALDRQRAQVFSTTAPTPQEVVVEYPIGHRAPAQGRHAGAGGEVPHQPRAPLSRPSSRRRSSSSAWTQTRLEQTPVHEFVDLFVI